MMNGNVESIRKKIDNSGNYTNESGNLYKSVGELNSVSIDDLKNKSFYRTEADAANNSNSVTINFDYLNDKELFTDKRGRVYAIDNGDAYAFGWIDKDSNFSKKTPSQINREDSQIIESKRQVSSSQINREDIAKIQKGSNEDVGYYYKTPLQINREDKQIIESKRQVSPSQINREDSSKINGDQVLEAAKNQERKFSLNDGIVQILMSSAATVANFAISKSEGVYDFAEKILDTGAMALTVPLSIPAMIDDLSKGRGPIGKSVNELWEGTRANVEPKVVKSAVDSFYNNTSVGKFIKDNSYYGNTVRSAGNTVGGFAGFLGTALLTGGGSLAAGPMAVVGGVSGTSGSSVSAWNNGASTLGGVGAGLFGGAASAGLSYVGAKALGSSVLQPIQRIAAGAALGGSKTFIDSAVTTIGNDNTSYGQEFEKHGGLGGVAKNAAIGGAIAGASEAIRMGSTTYEQLPDEPLGIKGPVADSQYIRDIDLNGSAPKVVYSNGPVNNNVANTTESVGAITSRNYLGIEGGIDSNAAVPNVVKASGPTVPYQQVAKPSIVDADVIDGRAFDSATVTTNMGNDLNVNELGQKIIDTTRNALENQGLIGK